MPPENRCIQNTDRLLSYAFQSQKLSRLSVLHFYQPPLCLSFLFSPSLLCSTCSAMGPSGSMAARPLPYSLCHAQVIRPHYEDICATLINEPVVLPLNLFSPSLSCPCLSSGCGLPPALPPDVCPCTVAATRL